MLLERFIFCNLWLSVLICLMLGMKWLLRNRLSMRLQYISWYILLLSIPFSFLPTGILKVHTHSRPISLQTFAIASAESEAVNNVPLNSQWIQDTTVLMYKTESKNILFAAVAIWMIGVLVLLSIYWCGSNRLRMIGRYALPPSPKIQSLFDKCCFKLRMNKHIELRQSLSIAAPISFGVKKHLLYCRQIN